MAESGSSKEVMSDAERRRIWQGAFGVEPPDWRPDEQAPPIDEQLLRLFVEKKISPEEGGRLLQLTLTFKSWRDAYGRILADIQGKTE